MEIKKAKIRKTGLIGSNFLRKINQKIKMEKTKFLEARCFKPIIGVWDCADLSYTEMKSTEPWTDDRSTAVYRHLGRSAIVVCYNCTFIYSAYKILEDLLK